MLITVKNCTFPNQKVLASFHLKDQVCCKMNQLTDVNVYLLTGTSWIARFSRNTRPSCELFHYPKCLVMTQFSSHDFSPNPR